MNTIKAYDYNLKTGAFELKNIVPKFIIKDNLVSVKTLNEKKHPLNKNFYKDSITNNKEEKHINDLVNGTGENDEFSFKKRYKDGLWNINHEPIKVCPYTGTIWGGNSRAEGLEKVGALDGYTVYADHIYNKKIPESVQLKIIQDYNLKGKRNEHSKSTIWQKFNELRIANEKDTGEVFNTRKKIFKSFIRDFLSTYQLKEYELNILLRIEKIEDDKVKKDLLLNIDDLSYNNIKKLISKAKTIKTNKVYNPDRFKFLEDLKQKPSLRKAIRYNIAKTIERSFNNTTIYSNKLKKEIPLMKDKTFGFETSAIIAHLSHITMSATAMAYFDQGYEVQTAAQDIGTDDIYFTGKSEKAWLLNKDFYREMLDVKACLMQASFSTTKISGGPGFIHISEHEYIWPIFNDNFTKIFLMMATLNKNDVRPDKSGGTVSLSDWFKNHYEKKDFYFIAGNIFEGNKKPEIQWENVKDLLNPKTDKEVI